MIFIILTKIIIILTLLSQFGTCWIDAGHILTARIAQIRLNQLNPSVSEQFNSLVTSINHLCDERSQTMIESACWPDDIKQKQYQMTIWNSWHFIDSPYIYDHTKPVINITETVVHSLSVMDTIFRILKTNLFKNTAQRALFGRFLIHLVGDMHQPLHSATLYNQSFPKSDYGGNRLKIQVSNGSKVNLHFFWDAAGLNFHNQSWYIARPLNKVNLSSINQIANQFIQQYGQQIQQLSSIIDPIEWTLQSFKIAVNTTYRHMLNSSIANDAYTALTYETSKKRITLAGYRLANCIIDIYTNSTIEKKNYSKYGYWNKMVKQINNLIMANPDEL